jgi:hypothetical protein
MNCVSTDDCKWNQDPGGRRKGSTYESAVEADREAGAGRRFLGHLCNDVMMLDGLLG